jgi:two-component system, cell cycle response regulator DivK
MTSKLEQNSRPVVLIVEDHEDTRFMLRMILEHEGYGTLEVADGLEAVELASREHPDLIMMDGNLPGLDGLSTTRRMREQEHLREVPIIALSGHAGQEFQAKAYAAGCDACITKPFDFTLLKNTLYRLLPKYSHAA